MPSYQYRKFHCGYKTVVRFSYCHNGGITYFGKTTSLPMPMMTSRYSDTDLCEHWSRLLLVAWWHQAITWTNVDLNVDINGILSHSPQTKFTRSNINFKISICKVSLKYTHVRLLLHFTVSQANEFKLSSVILPPFCPGQDELNDIMLGAVDMEFYGEKNVCIQIGCIDVSLQKVHLGGPSY